ncbi:hypothetical protein ACFL15_00815 [Patescibacteria group bacterium]
MSIFIKKFFKVIYVAICLLFFIYLILPAPDFPLPPEDAVQSIEEADTETTLRRAYFTNFDRNEVIKHYQNQLNISSFVNIPYITYRLNYPPEESQALIRDQTRSTFLEEIVHPLRESVFVNGFEPKMAKDDIWYKGVHYRQKIIIRYVPGNLFIRLFIALLIVGSIFILIKEWKTVLINLFKYVRKN